MLRKCPKCGNEEFEIDLQMIDSGRTLVQVDDDGDIERTSEIYSEECVDTVYSETMKCKKCGAVVAVEESPDKYREVAKERFAYDDDHEVDNDAKVSHADGGAWVQVWEWVCDSELESCDEEEA